MTEPKVGVELRIEEMSDASWRIAVYIEGQLCGTAGGSASFDTAQAASIDFIEMVKSIHGVAEASEQ